jgi:subtilisin family serine protease
MPGSDTPAGGGRPPIRWLAGDDEGRPGRLQRLLARPDMAVGTAELGGEFWYRPGELLVDDADVDVLRQELRTWAVDDFEPLDDLGVTRVRVARHIDVPGLVKRLRHVPGGPPPRIGPNHVLMGEQRYQGGPGDDPHPDGEPDPWQQADRTVDVGVADTGLVEHDRLQSRVTAGPQDTDTLDDDGDDRLDDQAGHGTFVAGIVAANAPAAHVQMVKVLDSWGVGDEVTVARGIRRLAGCQVINLSLGCYTTNDSPPWAVVRALQALPDGTVVVAAAGNHGSRRPFWPAALKGVVAVAALDAADGSAAPFSNFGWWVDACAPGVRALSTFVEFNGPREPLEPGNPDPDHFEGWARWSGTSFAAPLVAARIAQHAATNGVSAREAAYRLVGCDGLDRRPDLGAVVA